MNIAVIGTGYVGLVAGACFADTGNDVICVDNDAAKVDGLNRAVLPIYEPGLEDIVERNVGAGRLAFTTSLREAIEASEVLFIAVGTPQQDDGEADLTSVFDVARAIASAMNGPKIVVMKSTVPVGTTNAIGALIRGISRHQVDMVSNPEFLKEGAAVDDFQRPDRVIVGATAERAREVMRNLYGAFMRVSDRVLMMDVESAEVTKYASNLMLATRISVMNEVSRVCDKVGADVESVRLGVGMDGRIGPHFLFAGLGYGGACFPKDVQAFIQTAKRVGVSLQVAPAVEQVNSDQKLLMVRKLEDHFGGQLRGMNIAIWGLAFKPRTDDTRLSPSLEATRFLLQRGCRLRLHDPIAGDNFRARLGEVPGVRYDVDQYAALDGADALILCTEWNNYRNPNFPRMRSLLKHPVVLDGRNVFSRSEMLRHGFTYYSVGRPAVLAPMTALASNDALELGVAP